MNERIKTDRKSLKKLIDIPAHIVIDLKRMAIDKDLSLKGFIEQLLQEVVEQSRGKQL